MPLVAPDATMEGPGRAGSFSCLVDLDAPCNLICAACSRTSRGLPLDETSAIALAHQISEQVLAAKRSFAEIVFFGGEPLIAAGQLLRQLRVVRDGLARAGVAHRISLLTNGTLLGNSLAARLADAGLTRVLVTISGCRTRHDQRRKTRDGDPTYDRILANLAAARRHLDVRLRYEILDREDQFWLLALMADLMRLGCLTTEECLRIEVQGPSSYAAQARRLISSEKRDAVVRDPRVIG